MVKLSEALSKWREALNMTQKEAAAFLRVPIRTYQEWEQGRRKPKQDGPLRKVMELSKR